eukprot:3019531-Pleurochrysis_carterae.AAC.1
MAEGGGVQAFLSTAVAGFREGEAGEGTRRSVVPTAAKLKAAAIKDAESSFECRFIDCLHSLLEHCSSVTEKSAVVVASSGGKDERASLKEKAKKLGLAVAEAF